MRAVLRGAGVGLVVAVSLAVSPAALAAPPHGEGGHHHHVNTGDGGCRDVSTVAFHAQDRGLHQGANASGRDDGPWHGPCQ
jgi:hypothetical protein